MKEKEKVIKKLNEMDQFRVVIEERILKANRTPYDVTASRDLFNTKMKPLCPWNEQDWCRPLGFLDEGPCTIENCPLMVLRKELE